MYSGEVRVRSPRSSGAATPPSLASTPITPAAQTMGWRRLGGGFDEERDVESSGVSLIASGSGGGRSPAEKARGVATALATTFAAATRRTKLVTSAAVVGLFVICALVLFPDRIPNAPKATSYSALNFMSWSQPEPSITSYQCTMPHVNTNPEALYVRPLQHDILRDLPFSRVESAECYTSHHPVRSETVVSPALSSRNALMPAVVSVHDRLTSIEDYFAQFNDLAEDEAELRTPWAWAQNDAAQLRSEQDYAKRLWQSRLFDKDAPLGPVPMFNFDTRFRRFRGRPVDSSLTVSQLSVIPVGFPETDVKPGETTIDLCNRVLAYNPVLFHALPCPILWWDSTGRQRWNKPAEKAFYNLLKEQQFPSQHMLPFTQSSREAAASPQAPPPLDCAKMKYIVLYGMGAMHGLFSRFKSYNRNWRSSLAMDTGRIVVWEHRRNGVAHSKEEDYMEKGMQRYFSPISACSRHPYVLAAIRDAHDDEEAWKDVDRFMPRMKFFLEQEEAYKPENQNIQFWRFGVTNIRDQSNSPYRRLLFDFGITPFGAETDDEAAIAAGKPTRAQRPREFANVKERHEFFKKDSLTEHIYRAGAQVTSQYDRDYLYSSFVQSMLVAFSYNPTPDIQLMTKQLELHWSNQVWDQRVEEVRNKELERLMSGPNPPANKYVGTWEAWKHTEIQIATTLVAGLPPNQRASHASSWRKSHPAIATDESASTFGSAALKVPTCMASNSNTADGPLAISLDPAVSSVLSELRTQGSSSFHLHQNSFASIFPAAGIIIRRGDKAIEDPFYQKYGQFRPISMFAWKLHDEESRRSERNPDLPPAEAAAWRRFRFNSIFLTTDDLPAYNEVLYCASLPAVQYDNATHYESLLLEAVATEKAEIEASTAVSLAAIEALRAEAKAKRERGEFVDKYMIEHGVPWDPDGGIRHLLTCPKVVTPRCSPLSRLILGGRTIMHNVFAPQACFHPFKRVGYQQFLASFHFLVRNAEFWVGGKDSGVAQVLATLTDLVRQKHAHPQVSANTHEDPDLDPTFVSLYHKS